MRIPFIRFTPEDKHHLALAVLGTVGKVPTGPPITRKLFGPSWDQMLPVPGPNGELLPHPIGLLAGYSKDGEGLVGLQEFGFSWMAVGTVTPKPQAGNPKPRVWRFPKDRALINAMGFPSKGALRVARTLERIRHKLWIPLGISAGKQKETSLTDAWQDYVQVMHFLDPYADFWEVNISSPNTAGLRDLQGKEYLSRLTSKVRDATDKPVLVKVSPDLTEGELEEILLACKENGINGLTIGNTTQDREGLSDPTDVPGGLSGPMLLKKSLPLVALARQMDPVLFIIGAGGVFTGEDALRMMNAGANLVGIFTSLVCRGPRVVRHMLSELQAAPRKEEPQEALL